MAVVIAGAYPYVLNLTVLGVALPEIARDLGQSSVLDVDWLVTAYLLAISIIQPGTGWMSDNWGSKRVYSVALAAFGVGSSLAALAPTLEFLVIARVVQGLAGGAMMPLGLAMVYEAFDPRRRGFALGIWGVAIMVGPMLGPPLGGYITAYWSWRIIFWVMVPLVALALMLSERLLRDSGYRNARRIDRSGWVLASTGLIAIILAVRQAPIWGMASPRIVGLACLGLALLIAFIALGRKRGDASIIDFAMFRVSRFNLCLLVGALLGTALYANLTFIPIQLQFVQGRSAANVGLLLVFSAAGTATLMPIGGWLVDRIGPRAPVTMGLGTMAMAAWSLAHVGPATTDAVIVRALTMWGVGNGLAVMPTFAAAMDSLPTHFAAQASVMRSLVHQISGAIGTAILSALVISRLGLVIPAVDDAASIDRATTAYGNVFKVSSGLLLLAMIGALFLPGWRQTSRRRAEWAAEPAEPGPDNP